MSPIAIDPICKMEVDTANPPAVATIDGETFYFCLEGCKTRYVTLREAEQKRNSSKGWRRFFGK